MSPSAPLVVTNGRLVRADGHIERGAVRCEGDRITALGADVAPQDGDRVHDAGGQLIAPGLVDFGAALKGADVVMMLRLQLERMQGQFIPSPREYRHLYGLTLDRLATAQPDALVMHPGPMNRGVEIDSNVADMVGRSQITTQVEMGVALRMACLEVLTRRARAVEGWA